MLQQLAEIEPDVLDRFGVDAVGLDNTSFDPDGGVSFWKPDPENDEGEALIPRSANVAQEEDAGIYLFRPGNGSRFSPRTVPISRIYRRPLLGAESVSDLDRVDWEAWGAKDIAGLKKRLCAARKRRTGAFWRDSAARCSKRVRTLWASRSL
jgi:hypothetical protein